MPNAIHILEGNEGRKVWLDGIELQLDESQKVRNHSPDGFNWGYGGSSCAQLALAIVLKLTGKPKGYQTFKWKFIASLPMGKSFRVMFTDIDLQEIISGG